MRISRRRLLQTGLAAPVAGALGEAAFAQSSAPQGGGQLPPAFNALKPIAGRFQPVSVEEFQARMARAQKLMADSKPAFDALYMSPSSTMYYFAGLRWGGGERLMALTIPRKGDPFLVCPAFEERRLRELVRWPMEVRAWQEDESPYSLVVKTLGDRGLRTGRIGVNEATPFFFADGLRKAGTGFEIVSGDPITIGCRARKTAHELELMALANECTLDVYRAVFASLREGITHTEVNQLIGAGYRRMGLSGGAIVLFGEWAALPHGTTKPQVLKPGDVVLIDGGTSVEGYASDVTRTSVWGTPSDKVKRAFDTVRKSQDAALAAARKGQITGAVDDAARKVVTDAGFGKGYELFTHRVGHGIGLDGHEHPYLVRGSKTVLEPGMTFSNEPGIYIPGEFGIRCEDIMAITDDGPARLLGTKFAASLENPCG